MKDLEQTADQINQIADFLARRDLPILSRTELYKQYGFDQADLLILVGGCIPAGLETAGRWFQDGIAKHLLLVGGEGHTTPAFRQAIKSRYPEIDTAGKMEAEIIADYLELVFGIDKNSCVIERQSANCGENARFSLQRLKETEISAESAILIQDATMQRRTAATFEKEWARYPVQLISYAPYHPHVVVRHGALALECGNPEESWGMWEFDHFLSLILGEIPRIHDDENGYGPNGKGFMVHIDTPREVWQAFTELKEEYQDLIRKPWEP